MQVGLGPGYIVLDGDPAPPSPKGHSPQFSADVCCGQTAGWIKMPPGTEVGLGPGDIVLDGDSSPQKGGDSSHPLFGLYCGQMAAWIKVPLGTKVGLGPGHVVPDGDPAPPLQETGTALNFWPMSIVAKQSPISATAEHLLYLVDNSNTDLHASPERMSHNINKWRKTADAFHWSEVSTSRCIVKNGSSFCSNCFSHYEHQVLAG